MWQWVRRAHARAQSRGPRTGSHVPEGGALCVDLWGAGGPGASGALPDELARARVVDPDFRPWLGPRVDGRRVEQGGRKCTLPLGKGCRAVLPEGREQGL